MEGRVEGGREGQVGWQGRWGPTCASLLMESPKPGAGSWVTQEAMSHWFLPSPKKLLYWDLQAAAQEHSQDLLQSTPMSEACPETSPVGVGAKGEQLS